jgi:uncharacterized protein (TIGR02453 family)
MPGFAGFGSKAWFDENRALYQSELLDPMVALLDDLTKAFAAAKIPLKADGKRSIFRINRDVRFSKDKSPYKTHCGAVMTRTGGKNDQGLLYLHIGPEGCFTAAGFHIPEPAELTRLRKAIMAKPRQFTAMEAKLAAGKLQLGTENRMTRLPRGFEAAKGTPVEGALRLKSFIVEEPLPAKLIARPALTAAVVDFARRAQPLLTYGWSALA